MDNNQAILNVIKAITDNEGDIEGIMQKVEAYNYIKCLMGLLSNNGMRTEFKSLFKKIEYAVKDMNYGYKAEMFEAFAIVLKMNKE